MTENENYFGNIVKLAREKAGYSTEKFAGIVGITPRYLQKIENEGNIPGYAVIRKIIISLEIDANYLFYENYGMEDFDKNLVIQKVKNCNSFQLKVINATLDALRK